MGKQFKGVSHMQIPVILLMVVLIAALVFMMRRKTTVGGSCCGSRETVEPKIKPKDRNKSHYPYHYQASIDGMVCSNCARRVENAFQKNDGILARVDLSGKLSDVRSKRPLSRQDVAAMLNGTSYSLMDLIEIPEGK